MPGFLYFLPDLPRLGSVPSQEVIASRGLAYAFEGRPFGRGCSGPAGKDGFMLGCRRRWQPGQLYFEAAQIWTPHPSGQYFVGYWPDQVPGPGDLAREKQLDGHTIELADDRQWQVPLARGIHDDSTPEQLRLPWSCNLPQRAAIDADGNWVDQGPLPRYVALWELVCGWNDFRRGFSDDPGHEALAEHWAMFKTRFDAAVQVLQANYVVGPVELSLLGALTKQHAKDVLDLAIDQPEFEQIVKKWLAASQLAQSIAAADGSNSQDGPADETKPTDQLLPTASP
jgi:hypothetical protein